MKHGIMLTRAEASIVGALLRQANDCRSISATSVANRANRLGLTPLQLDELQRKLALMDKLAEDDKLV